VAGVVLAIFAASLASPSLSLAGPFTSSCEALLEEEDEIEGGKENPEWILYLEQCELESKEHTEHPIPSPLDAAPDSAAFTGGLQLLFTSAFAVFVGLIGLSIVRRILGS
jgi:hypothetical protein